MASECKEGVEKNLIFQPAPGCFNLTKINTNRSCDFVKIKSDDQQSSVLFTTECPIQEGGL